MNIHVKNAKKMNQDELLTSDAFIFQEIYKKGGRKFGIAGMEPLGCLPGMRTTKPVNTSTCGEELNAISQLHNKVFAKVLLKLKGQLQDFIYSNPNFYCYLDDIVHNPSKHGIYIVLLLYV